MQTPHNSCVLRKIKNCGLGFGHLIFVWIWPNVSSSCQLFLLELSCLLIKRLSSNFVIPRASLFPFPSLCCHYHIHLFYIIFLLLPMEWDVWWLFSSCLFYALPPYQHPGQLDHQHTSSWSLLLTCFSSFISLYFFLLCHILLLLSLSCTCVVFLLVCYEGSKSNSFFFLSPFPHFIQAFISHCLFTLSQWRLQWYILIFFFFAIVQKWEELLQSEAIS